MTDVLLHILGALVLQAGLAALGALGVETIGLSWRAGLVAGAALGGAASALLWRAREIRQARTKASGRVNTVEWVGPAVANVAGLAAAVAAAVAW